MNFQALQREFAGDIYSAYAIDHPGFDQSVGLHHAWIRFQLM